MSVTSSATARRLAAATLAAGALTGAVALPAYAVDHARPDQPRVEISDAHYASPDRDDRSYGSNRSLNKEWVEVTNNSRREVNLDGWTLRNEDGRTYTFHHVRLHGRSTVRIHTGVGRDTRTDLYQDRRTYVWDDRADTVTLRNDRNRFVDEYSWGDDRDDRGNDRHYRGDDRDDRGNDRHYRGDDRHQGDDRRDDRDDRHYQGDHH
ncbi:lamin tail domain-containing protein [Streptomyces sp. NPDC002928]|uniref:lamin tail domain-containing protein n=1 Tax=Streptomyces sp. NPDC002928 TaxID=3154440 RepID=UPI0033BD6C06